MPRHPSPPTHLTSNADNGIAALLRRLRHDGLELLRTELALARAELVVAANKLVRGALAGLFGALLMLSGLLALVAAAIIALSLWVPLWLAAGAVGMVLLIAGMLTARAARTAFDAQAVALAHTRHSVQQDLDVIKRTAHEQAEVRRHERPLDPGARAPHGGVASAG